MVLGAPSHTHGRRQRRLRQWLRHERLSVAMALAETYHHSAPRRPTMARAGGWERVALHAAGAQHFAMDAGEDDGEAPAAGRPAPLLEVLPQVGVQWHTVEQRIEHTAYVQILDAPVPLKMEQLVDFFKNVDIEVPAQVIEVPKISQDIIPQRPVDLVPQIVEQLVEVPTVLTPTRIAVQIAEQIVDTLVPRGRDRRRLQGSLPGQSSTTSLSSGKRISDRIMEQIVDFPEQTVEQIVDTSPGGSLAQGSSSSAGPADEDFAGGFSHFSPREKKCACRRESECESTSALEVMDAGGLSGVQWFRRVGADAYR